jgi:hypothetical protein
MSAPVPSRRVERLLLGLLAVATTGALLAWLAIALVHLDDRERVGHVQGAWMALAGYTNDGTLYPALFDGERYGGTRWMPLGIVLHALAARLVGSELLGGKAVTLFTTLALLGAATMVLRRLGSRWPVAWALLAAALVTNAGLFTTTTIGVDVLAAALQVGALALYVREATQRATATATLVGAGVLAGLAPLAKLTAGWAALAILCHLAAGRRWRELGVFLAAAAGTTVVGLGLALAVSDGRLWDSVGRLMLAGGLGPVAIVRAPNQVVYNLAEFAPGMLAVVPFALGSVLLVRGWRDLSVLDWALAWALLAVLAAFTDIGTGLNQLIDLLVLVVLVAAQLPHRLAQRFGDHGRALGVGALAVGALSALAAGVVLTLVPALRTAVDVARHGHPLPTVPLADVIEPDDTLLSEDPYVPVALGRRPVVLDAFMIRRLDELDPALVNPLIERIEAGGYDYLLLLEELHGERDAWWEDYHFGVRIVEAMRRAYEPMGRRDGYLVYRPKR